MRSAIGHESVPGEQRCVMVTGEIQVDIIRYTSNGGKVEAGELLAG